MDLSKGPKAMKATIERIGSLVISGIETLGGLILLAIKVVAWLVRPPYRLGLFFEAMEGFGVGSLFIVAFTGIFTGFVLSYQSILAFGMFNAESLVGGTVAVAMVRELAPVLAGLMVAGRTGSSMATEIGTMRVTEQIDAMTVMAVNPIQYLVVPRVVAAILMMPLLVAIFNVAGLIASYILAVHGQQIDPGMFLAKIKTFVSLIDVFYSCLKGSVFGGAIALIACYMGFTASGGAKGVGEATISSVVLGCISVLVLDYSMTIMFW